MTVDEIKNGGLVEFVYSEFLLCFFIADVFIDTPRCRFRGHAFRNR